MGQRRVGRAVWGCALAGAAVALAFWAMGVHGEEAALAGFASALVIGLGALSVLSAPVSSGPLETADPLRLEMERVNRELHALHTAVSHDLRSPLRGVLNFVAVLEIDHGPELDSGARKILGRVRASAEDGIAVLDGLARLSHVERSPLEREALEVDAIVREAFAEVAPERDQVELSVSELPKVFADRTLLRAAFRELLANGVKFSAGRERAHVAVSGRSTPEGEVVFSVADDGVGFEPRYAAKLFEVFERGHVREEFPGAGIGLAVVRRVAERHGGRAWAEAEPEGGARLHLALPLSQT